MQQQQIHFSSIIQIGHSYSYYGYGNTLVCLYIMRTHRTAKTSQNPYFANFFETFFWGLKKMSNEGVKRCTGGHYPSVKWLAHGWTTDIFTHCVLIKY